MRLIKRNYRWRWFAIGIPVLLLVWVVLCFLIRPNIEEHKVHPDLYVSDSFALIQTYDSPLFATMNYSVDETILFTFDPNFASSEQANTLLDALNYENMQTSIKFIDSEIYPHSKYWFAWLTENLDADINDNPEAIIGNEKNLLLYQTLLWELQPDLCAQTRLIVRYSFQQLTELLGIDR